MSGGEERCCWLVAASSAMCSSNCCPPPRGGTAPASFCTATPGWGNRPPGVRRRLAPGFRVARTCGVEAEVELPFAALHQLCFPVLEPAVELPAPQQAALEIAFGLRSGPAPGRFLVGLAVLSLLSATAGRQPLVCVVDERPVAGQ